MVDQATVTKVRQHIGARYMVYGSIQGIDNTMLIDESKNRFGCMAR